MKNKLKKSVFLLSSLMMLTVGAGVVGGISENPVEVAEAAVTQYVKISSVEELTHGSQIIITATSGSTYYVPNGTASAKKVKAKTISVVDSSISTDVTDVEWTVEIDADGYYSFKSSTDGTYIHVSDTNNGVSVASSGVSKLFTVEYNGTYAEKFEITSTAASNRSLTLYKKQDWRCYKESSAIGSNPQVRGLDIYKKSDAVVETVKTFFDYNYDGSPESLEVSTAKGQSITFPSGIPTRENYVFTGWFNDVGEEVTSLNAEVETTLYAGWKGVNVILMTPETFKSFPNVALNDVVENTSYPNEFTFNSNGYITSNTINGVYSIVLDVYGNYNNFEVYNSNSNDGTPIEFLAKESIPSGLNGYRYTYLLGESDGFYVINTYTGSSHVYAITINYTGELENVTPFCNVRTTSSLGFAYTSETSGEGYAVSKVFADDGFDNGTEITTLEKDNVTFTFDKGSNSNTPKYYTDGAAIRVYGGGTVTVSSTGTINKIEITFGTGDKTNEITASSGTLENGVWTGEANSVTFTVTGTSGHRRFAGFEVTGGNIKTTYTFSDVRIRFKAIVTSDEFNSYVITKAGFEVSAEGWSKSMDIDCTGNFDIDEDGNYFMICSIWNIPEEAYDSVLTAKAYFEVAGVRYYADDTSYSIKTLANTYLTTNVYNDLTDDAKGAITAFNAQLA